MGDDTRISEIDTQNKIARLLQKAALVLTMRVRTTVLDIAWRGVDKPRSPRLCLQWPVSSKAFVVSPRPCPSGQEFWEWSGVALVSIPDP